MSHQLTPETISSDLWRHRLTLRSQTAPRSQHRETRLNAALGDVVVGALKLLRQLVAGRRKSHYVTTTRRRRSAAPPTQRQRRNRFRFRSKSRVVTRDVAVRRWRHRRRRRLDVERRRRTTSGHVTLRSADTDSDCDTQSLPYTLLYQRRDNSRPGHISSIRSNI